MIFNPEWKIKNVAFIALGSNKGDKFSYLEKAVQKINSHEKIDVLKVSSVYETKPFGVNDQDNYLNTVIKLETDLNLSDLFFFIKELEKELGRMKTYKWGPREIDLDLLFFNDEIYSDDKVTVPHKEIIHRDFVLTPLNQIEPELFHPVLKQKISDICISESDKTIIRIINKQISTKAD